MKNFIQELKDADETTGLETPGQLLNDIRYYLTAIKYCECLAEEIYVKELIELIDKKK